jgi:hypothetical protein
LRRFFALKLKSDIASASFAPLLRHAPNAFMILTYCAGSAYTLSPGKLGELMRARDSSGLSIPLKEVAACIPTVAAPLVLGLRRAPKWAPTRNTQLLAQPSSRISRLALRAAELIAPARVLTSGSALLAGLGIGVAAEGLEAIGLGVLTLIVPSSHISMTTAIGTYALATAHAPLFDGAVPWP